MDALNESWMFFLWSSDASPYKTDSVSSRLPIAVIPASFYVIDDSGINLTLQTMTREITSSFNRMSSEGIKIRKLASMGRGTAPVLL